MFRTVALFTAVVVSLPLNARADVFDNQIRLQMAGAALGAAFTGFSLREDIEIGSLREGASTSFLLDVRDGVQYLLVANCDSDCDDVDLELRETDGTEVAVDRRNGDVAIVAVPSGHPGNHRVTVSMASCRRNPCRFGLGLFTK